MESQSPTLITMASTTSIFANPRVFQPPLSKIVEMVLFEESPKPLALGFLDNTACALFADFDNDGLQDVVVVRASGPLLFLNQAAETFRARNLERFSSPMFHREHFTGAGRPPIYDRDGWLDIYFVSTFIIRAPINTNIRPYHDAENGPPIS